MTKPIVHYKNAVTLGVNVSAYLEPVDHPNHIPGHDVSNEMPVRTSKVVEINEATGIIETRNTMYVPLDGSSLFNGKSMDQTRSETPCPAP